MRLMVTGADGFVGKHLLLHLRKLYPTSELIAVVGPKSLIKGHEVRTEVEGVLRCALDVTDRNAVRELLMRHSPNHIYHLAGIAETHGYEAERYISVNAIGTFHVASEAFSVLGSSVRLLFVSSSAVYSPSDDVIVEDHPLVPGSDYAASKASAEMYLWPLIYMGLDARIVRSFNHTGPGQRRGFVCPDLIGKVSLAIHSNEKLILDSRRLMSVRDFTDVRDVVRAYTDVMEYASSGNVVNVCSSNGVAISGVLDEIVSIMGAEQFVEYDDSLRSDNDAYDYVVGDNSKLTSLASWKPVIQLPQTLREMVGMQVGGYSVVSST